MPKSSPVSQAGKVALCLCPTCRKHKHATQNGNYEPGRYVDPKTKTRHELVAQRDDIAQSLPQDDPPGSSSDDGMQGPFVPMETNELDELNLPTHPNGNDSGSSDLADNVIDTSPILNHNLQGDNPIFIHASLIASLMLIFENTSEQTSSWLLQAHRDNLEMTLSMGLESKKPPESLPFTTTLSLDRLPKNINTVIRWLKIEPRLILFNCCQSCFAIYPLDQTPKRCVHWSDHVPGALVEQEITVEPSAHGEKGPRMCLQPLLRPNGKPVRRYAVQDFHDWLTRFICQNSVEEDLDKSLEESRKPFSNQDTIRDIHHSRAWKEFPASDGTQYTARTGNLSFAMFVDGINPFGSKKSGHQVTDTFIVLVCLTLPYEARFLPENIYLAGIAPGPKEPSLEQNNWLLGSLVLQLQSLWDDGLSLSKTPLYPQGRTIYVALLILIADIPATRSTLGLASHSASAFCSICHLPKRDINNIDQASWVPRTHDEHQKWAFASRDAKTAAERNKIFERHGVRYSVLSELSYWSITNYHVIDSMHNLLLGLIATHLTKFWAMTEGTDNEPDPVPLTTQQLLQLAKESTTKYRKHRHQDPIQVPEGEVSVANADFPSDTTSGDDTYDPFYRENYGWDGSYQHPLEDKIVLDQSMLKMINGSLPRIHIPTWIGRAPPQLGKIGFKKLKADEYRSLGTIQLPLLLIPHWTGHNRSNAALLQNFVHLVCLTNLALKREMTGDRISKYRHHVGEYLKGSLQLFEHCSLNPNHHMAVHLAERLEKFGPVRAWWSFPFERFMGRVLRANHNNHLGTMEETLAKHFSCAGNLAALMKDESKLPPCLAPYTQKLRGIFEARVFEPQSSDIFISEPLDKEILQQLVTRLNRDQFDDEKSTSWVASDEWCKLSAAERENYSPLVSHAQFQHGLHHEKVLYTTFDRNPDNSVIHVKTRPHNNVLFGKIHSIFKHSRTPCNQLPITDTWLLVKFFAPVPPSKPDPFLRVGEPDLQTHLRLNVTGKPRLTHISEVVAHCAWIEYKSAEVHPLLDIKTVGLVSLDRV